jgi:hypothetical protein
LNFPKADLGCHDDYSLTSFTKVYTILIKLWKLDRIRRRQGEQGSQLKSAIAHSLRAIACCALCTNLSYTQGKRHYFTFKDKQGHTKKRSTAKEIREAYEEAVAQRYH